MYCAVEDLVLNYTGGFHSSNHANYGAQQLVSNHLEGRQVVVSEPLRACDTIRVNMSEKIALIQRGDCYFSTKVFNAEQQGAVAAIIFNSDGQSMVSYMVAVTADPVSIPSIFIEESHGDALNAAVAADPSIVVDVGCAYPRPYEPTMEPEAMEPAPTPVMEPSLACNPECQAEWEGAIAPAEVMCNTSYHVDCRFCGFCTDLMSSTLQLRGPPGWTIDSGPCEVFGSDHTCVGRPTGYLPNERCEITAHGGGRLDLCPVWNIDWTMDLPCFSRGESIPAGMGSAFMTEGCPDSGVCPAGLVLSHGDPVVWQSDGLIQGNVDSQWEGLIPGTSPPSNGTDGLGGGWALCFEYEYMESGSATRSPKAGATNNLEDLFGVGVVVAGAVGAVIVVSSGICCCICCLREQKTSVAMPVVPSRGDVALQLQQLAAMHSNGQLSDAEFEAAKVQTLRSLPPAQGP